MKASTVSGARGTSEGRIRTLRGVVKWVGLVAAITLPAGALAQPSPGKPPGKIPAPSGVAKPGTKDSAAPGAKGGAAAPKGTAGVTTPPPKGATGVTAGPPSSPLRWTSTTPDQMVDLAFSRARRGGDDAIAGLLVASMLDERAAFGRVRTGLRSISVSASPLADDARWLMTRLTPEPMGKPWPGAREVSYDAPADPSGLVKAFAILGPFADTGGGVLNRQGPEAPGQSFSDMDSRYSWGVFDVAWRRVLPASATARGVPLDLYIYPRSETCTYLASKVTIPADAAKASRPILVHVASTGAVRLIWDGADVAASEEVHADLVLDRMAARIEATPGDHLVAVKVCSAALPDDGRVRVRFTDEKRKPIAVASSSNLRGLRLPAAATTATAATSSSAPAKGEGAAKPKGASGTGAPTKGAGVKATAAGAKATAAGPKAAAAGPKATATGAKATTAGGKKGAAPEVAPAAVTPGTITRVKTALEKALDIGPTPTADQVLTASIVRTFGGADDARSPRAPGLLDRVARTPEITPDTLAMAGWVSPFGSNRSGWLNLARARGAAEGDPMTLAFAQRRLAASNLSSNLVDWAISTLRDEPLHSATDPEARLIKAIAKKQLGAAGLTRAALDDLLAIEGEQKFRTPISVWAEIADAARAQPLIAQRAIRRLGDTRADARGYTYVRSFRATDSAALEIAAAQTLMQQTSADEIIQIGRELFDAGRYAWAREVFYQATKVAPNRSIAFQWLATARRAAGAVEKQDAATASKEMALATGALGRARDLEPGDPFLKAELDFRTGTGADSSATADRMKMRDEQYVPEPKVFLDRARANPAKKGEIVDRQLHWVRVVTYHPDKRVSQLMHYAREIVIEPRTESDLFERGIPSEGDDTELLLARVHRKDGTVVAAEEQGSGGRSPFIRWPELKAGDVVEVAVRSWTKEPVGRRGDAPFYFIDYVGSIDTHPILYNEVVVEAPEGSPLALDVLNGKPDRATNETKGGRLIRRFVWDNPPSVPDEPLAPKLSESLPVVVGSTFAGWGEFRAWYKSAIVGFTEPDEQVKRLADELTKGKKTREEKLKALFDFVADDIQYVNYQSGEFWLPNRPQVLLALRKGDCDDKAMLLITLLRSIGIEATEVLVQTRYGGEPSLLRSEKAAIPVFDHGIAYLPGKKGEPGLWLDATSPQSRLGPLPAMDSRTLAMFVDDGPAKIIETPASSPADHGVDAEWTIKLLPTGAGDLTAKERHIGDAAFELRTNLGQADAQAQWVEQYLASGWFPTVQVKPQVTFQGDLPNGAASLSYEAHSEGIARREGGELAVPVSEGATLTSQLAPLVKRTLPIVLPPSLAPGHQTRTITIVAPPGFRLADLPPGGEESGGEFGTARLEFKRGAAPNTVVVKRTVVFDMSTIPLDKYAKWRGWLQRIDGLMHRMVRLVPSDEGGKPAEVTADAIGAGTKVDARGANEQGSAGTTSKPKATPARQSVAAPKATSPRR